MYSNNEIKMQNNKCISINKSKSKSKSNNNSNPISIGNNTLTGTAVSIENNLECIPIDKSDPLLMWNCAVLIGVFVLLIIFYYLNNKSTGCVQYEDLGGKVDSTSIMESLTTY